MLIGGTHRAQQERESRGYQWLWSGIAPALVTGVFTDFSFHAPYSVLGLKLSGAGNGEILPGIKGYYPVPFDCQINHWTILADLAGSIAFDIYKCAYADFPPTNADTIIGLSAEQPALVNEQTAQDRYLTGWNTTLTRGDILAIEVMSIDVVTSVTLSLFVTRNNKP